MRQGVGGPWSVGGGHHDVVDADDPVGVPDAMGLTPGATTGGDPVDERLAELGTDVYGVGIEEGPCGISGVRVEVDLELPDRDGGANKLEAEALPGLGFVSEKELCQPKRQKFRHP